MYVCWLLCVLKENGIELKLSLRHLVITPACCDYRDIVSVKDIQPHTHTYYTNTHIHKGMLTQGWCWLYFQNILFKIGHTDKIILSITGRGEWAGGCIFAKSPLFKGTHAHTHKHTLSETDIFFGIAADGVEMEIFTLRDWGRVVKRIIIWLSSRDWPWTYGAMTEVESRKVFDYTWKTVSYEYQKARDRLWGLERMMRNGEDDGYGDDRGNDDG